MTFQPDRSGLLEVPGASLAWRSTGEGPALLMIHAGIADQTMWDDDVPTLATDHQVVTYDCRGYGATSMTTTPYSNRADAIAVLDHLGIARAVILGASRGGAIALDTTLEFPDRAAGLIEVCGGLGGFDHEPTPEEAALFDSEEPMWEAKDWAGIADLDVRLWVDGVGQPADRVPAAIRERVRSMSLANYTAEHSEAEVITLAPPAVGRLSEVTVPALIIDGSLDTSDVRAAAAALEAGIAGARRVTVDGVAHMVNLERPEVFRELVRQFLASLD